MTTKEILVELKAINALDFQESKDHYWDGTLSYSGVKRMLYGLFHKGYNEKGEDMLEHMSPSAIGQYLALMENVKLQPQPFLLFNDETPYPFEENH